MSIFLEIIQLDNGDVVLREASDSESESPNPSDIVLGNRTTTDKEPLVRIRFSPEVNEMLGDNAVGVAEAMIDAAAAFLEADPDDQDLAAPAPVLH